MVLRVGTDIQTGQPASGGGTSSTLTPATTGGAWVHSGGSWIYQGTGTPTRGPPAAPGEYLVVGGQVYKDGTLVGQSAWQPTPQEITQRAQQVYGTTAMTPTQFAQQFPGQAFPGQTSAQGPPVKTLSVQFATGSEAEAQRLTSQQPRYIAPGAYSPELMKLTEAKLLAPGAATPATTGGTFAPIVFMEAKGGPTAIAPSATYPVAQELPKQFVTEQRALPKITSVQDIVAFARGQLQPGETTLAISNIPLAKTETGEVIYNPAYKPNLFEYTFITREAGPSKFNWWESFRLWQYEKSEAISASKNIFTGIQTPPFNILNLTGAIAINVSSQIKAIKTGEATEYQPISMRTVLTSFSPLGITELPVTAKQMTDVGIPKQIVSNLSLSSEYYKGQEIGIVQHPIKFAAITAASIFAPPILGGMLEAVRPALIAYPTLAAGALVGVKALAVGLPVLYGTSIGMRVYAEPTPELRARALGGIVSTEFTPMMLGSIASPYIIGEISSYGRTEAKGVTKAVKEWEAAHPGERYPTAPTKEHYKLFTERKQLVEELSEKQLAAFHQRGFIVWKGNQPYIIPPYQYSPREFEGLYVAPIPSPYFLRIGPTGIYGLDASLAPFGRPGTLAIIPTKYVKGTSGTLGQIFIPGQKAEQEGVVVVGTKIVPYLTGAKYYTYSGVKIPLDIFQATTATGKTALSIQASAAASTEEAAQSYLISKTGLAVSSYSGSRPSYIAYSYVPSKPMYSYIPSYTPPSYLSKASITPPTPYVPSYSPSYSVSPPYYPPSPPSPPSPPVSPAYFSPPIPIPWLPYIPKLFETGADKDIMKPFKGKRKYKYFPSFGAMVFKVKMPKLPKGKRMKIPTEFTGFEMRPLRKGFMKGLPL